MLATSARSVPDMAVAWCELPSALHTSVSPSFWMPTFGSSGRAMVPSGPFTEMLPEASVTSTPLGSGIGNLAMRDMAFSLRHDAEHFAADAVGARLAVRHHAARGGDDGHAQPVHDAGNVVAALVDAQPRLGNALQALDHRAAGVVLEPDAQRLHRLVLAHGEVLDVALVLQYPGDGNLQLRAGHADLRVPHHLGVADAGQHVGDRIGHAHARFSLPARLDHARHLAAHRQVAQLVAPQAELAVDAARAPRDRAAIAQPRRRRVARQLLQLLARRFAVLVLRPWVANHLEQRLAPGLEFGHGLAALLFAEFDGEFCHVRVPQCLNGKRNAASRAFASSSVFAVVVMAMFMPRSASILSYSISGKMICSLTPRL